MEVRSFSPHLILIGLMVLTVLALSFTVDVSLSDQPGVRMELPSSLDHWVGDELRFSHDPENPKQYQVSELDLPDIDPETGDPLFRMSLSEYDALPHDTEFRKSIYTNDVSSIFVSIVLSGQERNSIHRPQRCLTGQGRTIVDSEVFDIPMLNRDPLTVEILKSQIKYQDADGESRFRYEYYAYWFVGQKRETHSHYERMFWLAWDRVIHSVAHRWAYIAVAGDREAEDSEEYKEELIDFVQKLYPTLLLDEDAEGEG